MTETEQDCLTRNRCEIIQSQSSARDTGHLTKEQILEECRNATPAPGKNRMGGSESWYDPFFCIQQTFTSGQLGAMTEQELNNLYRLAQNITSALY